ncbi:uncharacterized protein PSFLO_04692 [Pseudozyma flocculosa]|uniref:Secreted protein n=1 Tax=Pseudozyma flocculosa TaxID=84751 RepID=A0A5C3F4E7_9BASI|nr:uncharacterized protein PSFLO_04692 [Pseudozyma flocculosa]
MSIRRVWWLLLCLLAGPSLLLGRARCGGTSGLLLRRGISRLLASPCLVPPMPPPAPLVRPAALRLAPCLNFWSARWARPPEPRLEAAQIRKSQRPRSQQVHACAACVCFWGTTLDAAGAAAGGWCLPLACLLSAIHRQDGLPSLACRAAWAAFRQNGRLIVVAA